MYDVAALGELLIDFTPDGTSAQGAPRFACNPGGAPANVLAMVAKLGGKCAFLGKVGTDSFGVYLRRALEESGIEAAGLRTDENVRTTLAFVQLTEAGERSFTFYRNPGADIMLTPNEVDLSVIDQAGIFHFGSLSLTDEPCRSATLHALSRASGQGKLVSYDPNYRPLLWDSVQHAVQAMRSALPRVHLLKVSEEELFLLSGESGLEQGARQLLKAGPSLVFVSMGADGACYFTQRFEGFAPAHPVQAVDTTGAGDAFWGAVLYCLRGRMSSDLELLEKEELDGILRFANAAGALTTTRLGAIPALPSIEEINALRM